MTLTSLHSDPPSDAQLVERAQGGCSVSFDELIRRHQTPVLHFLQRRGAGADSEDLTQETFVRAYVHLKKYRSEWPFSAWLFTIARRLSINHARRKAFCCEGGVESVACRSQGPESQAAASDERQKLWNVAERILSRDELSALWLHYVEGMPAPQIARVLERSWVGVKTMLFRARKKLLPLLDNPFARREAAEVVETASASEVEAPYA